MHGDISSQVWTALFIKHPLSPLKKIFHALSLTNMLVYVSSYFSLLHHSGLLYYLIKIYEKITNEKKNPLIYYPRLNIQCYNVLIRENECYFTSKVTKVAVIFIDL